MSSALRALPLAFLARGSATFVLGSGGFSLGSARVVEGSARRALGTTPISVGTAPISLGSARVSLGTQTFSLGIKPFVAWGYMDARRAVLRLSVLISRIGRAPLADRPITRRRAGFTNSGRGGGDLVEMCEPSRRWTFALVVADSC